MLPSAIGVSWRIILPWSSYSSTVSMGSIEVRVVQLEPATCLPSIVSGPLPVRVLLTVIGAVPFWGSIVVNSTVVDPSLSAFLRSASAARGVSQPAGGSGLVEVVTLPPCCAFTSMPVGEKVHSVVVGAPPIDCVSDAATGVWSARSSKVDDTVTEIAAPARARLSVDSLTVRKRSPSCCSSMRRWPQGWPPSVIVYQASSSVVQPAAAGWAMMAKAMNAMEPKNRELMVVMG